MNCTHLSRWRAPARAAAMAVAALLGAAVPALAQNTPLPGSEVIVEARDAARRGDRARLISLRASTLAANHPLAMWVDFWELQPRLATATPNEVGEFFSRWRDTYVEDRLRNDWLLELGRRADWPRFSREFASFRMNDDREVTCYALLLRHRAGEDVTALARTRWLQRRDPEEGCNLLAATLYQARRFTEADAWTKVRLAAEHKRPRVARQAAQLVGEPVAGAVGDIIDQPARYLARDPNRRGGSALVSISARNADRVNARLSARQRAERKREAERQQAIDRRREAELIALALIRLAVQDPAAAAQQLDERWAKVLPAPTLAWVWAVVAREAAADLLPQAHEWYRRSAQVKGAGVVALSDDVLAWKARAALRAENEADRWNAVLEAVDAMSPAEQRDSAWVYWKARALQAVALPPPNGEMQRSQATALLEGLSTQMHFYGKLAAEELGRPQSLPEKPAALTDEELARARQHPGLTRALGLIAVGLRDEGVREWNFSLRGMDDRDLRAAAQRACNAHVWDRCINTSDRTRAEVDIEQRYPTPFRSDIEAAAREAGLDPAYAYGIIRQESRFMVHVRSSVGAMGLMQVMPGTARWTARKIGLDFRPEQIADPGTNLRIGTSYLKLVLDNFGGSQALAAAAYNAGPNRSRRWREGPTLEVAAWVENIPFAETRDYVKKVLSNATYYGSVLRGEALALKTRIAAPIGPAGADAPADNPDIP